MMPTSTGTAGATPAPSADVDLVVLNARVHTVNAASPSAMTVRPEKIKDIQVVRTVVGGTTMHEA